MLEHTQHTYPTERYTVRPLELIDQFGSSDNIQLIGCYTHSEGGRRDSFGCDHYCDHEGLLMISPQLLGALPVALF
ncbi:hypothetical protein PGT21_029498 [Puccinia graminis f. sp. tritici]|uniref:Uncharacterized protein n=1 Tax=Puccinia graminis f. sp. tritici TaxID=56615 RepID=A0A5B0P3Y1_PUCGR|nr:hypothetical protein PGT21_029498 [Puccinia graminis f. sp. tritici]KAA1121538.1 hypothetical protein PGTUg99_031435 [Puccinia graminis f. sp. tritici]